MHMEIKGDKLVITVDCSKAAFEAAVPSTSGKTKVVASTRGFTGIQTPNGVLQISANVTTK